MNAACSDCRTLSYAVAISRTACLRCVATNSRNLCAVWSSTDGTLSPYLKPHDYQSYDLDTHTARDHSNIVIDG